jgi:hypothetical protein
VAVDERDLRDAGAHGAGAEDGEGGGGGQGHGVRWDGRSGVVRMIVVVRRGVILSEAKDLLVPSPGATPLVRATTDV